MSAPLPLHKLEALKAAISGALLTSDQITTLEACVEDYRFIFRLGNGFKLNRDHLTELLQLVYEDAPFMVGERRKRAIRILHATGAKGFQVEPFWTPTRFDEGMATPIDEEEVAEVVYG